MKNILSILLISIIIFGCNEKRILIDELTDKGTDKSPLIYSESSIFNGIGYDIYTNGQLKREAITYKDGKYATFFKHYYENGQLKRVGNYKDEELDGLWKHYYENGQLNILVNYKDGIFINSKCWDKEGTKIDCE